MLELSSKKRPKIQTIGKNSSFQFPANRAAWSLRTGTPIIKPDTLGPVTARIPKKLRKTRESAFSETGVHRPGLRIDPLTLSYFAFHDPD
jgi:hypothetical protein